MNPLDIGVIAVIGLSAVFAFARGFVREALSIVAWVGAGVVTLYGFSPVYAIVEPMVHNPLLSELIAGFGLFLASLVVLTILTGIIARSVRSSALSPIDRTLGFIFGVLRGAFVLSLAYLVVEMTLPQPNDRPPWLREAKSVPYLQQGSEMLRNLLPESLRIKTATAAEGVVNSVSPATQAERAMRALSTPSAPPTGNTPQTVTPNYDRPQLDRLINNQR